MRKTFAIFQASPRRLLTQLLITLLLFSVLVASSGMKRCVKQKVAPEDITTKAQFKLNKANIKACITEGYSKAVLLKSVTSAGFITIKPAKKRRVSAKSRNSSYIYNYVKMTGYNCNNITIVRLKGIVRGNSLCFNKRGKLIQKEDASLGVRCAFREIPVPGHPVDTIVELRSALDPNLLIAFNKRGRSLRGGRYSGTCNYFQISKELQNLKDAKMKKKEIGEKAKNGSNSRNSGGYSNRKRNRQGRRNRQGSRTRGKRRNSRASKKSRKKRPRRVIDSTNSSREKIRHIKHKRRTRTEDRTDR